MGDIHDYIMYIIKGRLLQSSSTVVIALLEEKPENRSDLALHTAHGQGHPPFGHGNAICPNPDAA